MLILTVLRLVLETLEPLSDDRKCFRLINGVLVERTVKDVKPALKTNQDGLKKVLDDLVKSYKTKQDDLDKWKVCLIGSLSVADDQLTTSPEEEQCSSSAAIRTKTNFGRHAAMPDVRRFYGQSSVKSHVSQPKAGSDSRSQLQDQITQVS
jgi:prefoldin subunit 2